MPTEPHFPSHFKSQQDQELIRLALHKSPFFASLDEEQVSRFVAVAERKVYRKGEIVILEGCVDDDDDDDDDDYDDDEEEEFEGEEKKDASPPRQGSGKNSINLDNLAEPDDADEMMEEVEEKQHRSFIETNKVAMEKETTDRPESRASDRVLEGAKDDSTSDGRIHVADDAESDGAVNDVDIDDTSDKTERVPSDLQNESESLESSDDDEKEQANTQAKDGEDDKELTPQPPSNEKPLWTLSQSRGQSQEDSQPPPPRSGIKRSIYIVRSGQADVWYQPHFRPASLGQGAMFGEGGFVFGRQHSASVIAKEPLECWVVDFGTFQKHVLPSEHMQQLFSEHATQRDADGTPYMTLMDFMHARRAQELAPIFFQEDPVAGLRIAHTYNLFQQPKSRRRRRRRRRKQQQQQEQEQEQSLSAEPHIYLADFCFFHLLMARPDPEVDIAFLLMDRRRTGQVHLEDLAHFVEPIFPGLDLSSHFFQRYFGKDGTQSIRQMHFSQFLVDLQREIGKQAFFRAVQEKGTLEGYLNPTDFIHVLKTACGWRLPQGVAERLEAVYVNPVKTSELPSTFEQDASRCDSSSLATNVGLGARYFAYADFLAFQEILGNLPALCNLVDRAQEIKKAPITSDDFKVANRVIGLGGRLSRRQVEIVFSLFDLDRDGYISHQDTIDVCGINFSQRLVALPERGGKLSLVPSSSGHEDAATKRENKRDWKQQVGRFMEHFALTASASSVGVLLLYPLDLAKTRLMNERVRMGSSGRYKGLVDCLQQVFRFEGPYGFYRGLTPQLLGVAPEKMIKLQVNDLLRQALSSLDDSNNRPAQQRRITNFPLEVLAGAGAGASQLLFTNPMEISKIRMQLQGETTVLMKEKGFVIPKPLSFSAMVQELGFPGVYRGASACLLRDIPFSAIYFPTYALFKDLLIDERHSSGLAEQRITPTDIVVAGTMAAMPAVLLTNPADVIKTRLQSLPRPGEMAYTGINDCARRIYHHEGWQAFSRGSLARMLRIAPQFGISLLSYEQFKLWYGLDHNQPRPPTNAPVNPADYNYAFRASQ